LSAPLLAATAILCISGAPENRGVVPFSYSITDLGTLGGFSSVALDINELGHVCGGADRTDGNRHGFFWKDGVMTDLGTLGHSQSEAWGINNQDQVVGLSSGNGNLAGGFLWQGGQISEISPNNVYKDALALNDAGQVVGQFHSNSGDGDHAYRWQNDVLLDLDAPGAQSLAWGINQNGVVVGSSSAVSPPGPFRWENGAMIGLGTLGGTVGSASGINDSGDIVGWSLRAGSSQKHAFLWHSGNMSEIAALSAYDRSTAEDINNSGEVVGIVRISGLDEGYVYAAESGAYLLQNLVPPGSGWSEFSPRAINDAGQVVGDGTINGSRHACLMTRHPPVPALGRTGAMAMAIFLCIVGAFLARRAPGPGAGFAVN